MAMPTERGNLRLVPAHRAQFLSALNIPQLDVARADPDPKERAVIRKVHRRDVRSLGSLADLYHLARVCLPNVRVLGEMRAD